MAEIKNVRMLLPAMVTYEQNGTEISVFVYIDQMNKDVIVPDSSEIIDLAEFKLKFSKYFTFRKHIIPNVPRNLEKVDITRYGVEQ